MNEKIEEENREFFAELEAQRFHSSRRLTGVELLEIFPEAKEIIPLKISEQELPIFKQSWKEQEIILL